ncbi:hypothetical protein NCER_100612 [Vairimorpha ceranae BRL01]|uniref:Uncharacterized protein n=2 Tax=Vairimorpha ceranae TaxID=40302 RepID=C4V812_VAIC1|nr:hypothetical protein AAJ76_700098513 [Vairimorpha ceranae]EEQ82634.1 hypothetical protein NCER_100612 [Vairimorpha ceranae BRL01]KKO76102.1 hypothetical protein AAJ76_700098513 [Vairimorpha ceranae]
MNISPQIKNKNFENRFDLHFKDKLLTDISVDSVFELIRDIKDPEHPYTLEELNVVRKDLIKIYQLKDEYVVEDIINCIEVQFEPTIPHCSMAAIIGLIIKILLEKYIKGYYIIVSILEGSHVNDKMLNKQLKDKDRVQAASENEALLEIIDECLVSIIDKYDL